MYLFSKMLQIYKTLDGLMIIFLFLGVLAFLEAFMHFQFSLSLHSFTTKYVLTFQT